MRSYSANKNFIANLCSYRHEWYATEVRHHQNITDLWVELEGVVKQHQQLTCNKGIGQDDIPTRLLHDYAVEPGPILQFLFQQSYDTGLLPQDWKQAMVTGIYKKAQNHLLRTTVL